jgi:hypothetical protein
VRLSAVAFGSGDSNAWQARSSAAAPGDGAVVASYALSMRAPVLARRFSVGRLERWRSASTVHDRGARLSWRGDEFMTRPG